MKKFLGFIAIAVMFVLPLSVSAASYKENCSEWVNDTKSCSYTATFDNAQNTVTVVLTPKGGATIDRSSIAAGIDWTLGNIVDGANGSYTVTFTAPSQSGETDLFSFSYKRSGTVDCEVEVSINGSNVKTPTVTPDAPTENKQTGSTLPYIALGSLVVIAGAAYLVTKNKTKMYKI